MIFSSHGGSVITRHSVCVLIDRRNLLLILHSSLTVNGIKIEYQLALLGSVCRMFFFFSGLSLRFLKATSFPSPTERKVIFGVDRSLNFTTVEFGSIVVVC